MPKLSNVLIFTFSLINQCSRRSCFTVKSLKTSDEKCRKTVGHLLEHWKCKFEKLNISEPLPSIENILLQVIGSRDVNDIYLTERETLLSSSKLDKLTKMCEMRLKRAPVQYVIEEWDFRDLTLKMSPPVFIPRPETEMLVDLVRSEIDARKCKRVVDLGCGTGAICLSLLKSRPLLTAIAVDQSQEACKLTKENARTYNLLSRLQVINQKIDSLDLNEKFDVIVSNPPYVPSTYLEQLQPEILEYEDLLALDGGKDGLHTIKEVLRLSSKLLNPSGKLFLEVDSEHPKLLKDWLQQNDLKLSFVKSYKDYNRLERFVEIIKK